MKTRDYLKDLAAKDAPGLQQELAALHKEQFSLRMQAAMGQNNQPHLAVGVRRKIAQVQTVMRRKQANAS